MVKPVHVGPGTCRVAGFAAERGPVGPALCHAVIEFPVMHVFMAGRASHVRKVERQDLVSPPGQPNFMAIRTRNRGM